MLPSLGLDPRRPDHLSSFLRLHPNQRREFRARSRQRHSPFEFDVLAVFARGGDACDLHADFLEHRIGRAPGREDAVGEGALEFGKPRFGHGRYLRQLRHALRAGHRDRPQLADAYLGKRRECIPAAGYADVFAFSSSQTLISDW